MYGKIEARKAAFILVVAAIFSLMLTFTFFQYHSYLRASSLYQVEELGVDVYVGNNPGMNVDSDAIHFGILPPGGAGQRNIIITNSFTRSLVEIESRGDLAAWLTVDDNGFILEPMQNRTVTVSVSIPDDAEVPSYHEGRLMVNFFKV